MTVYLTLDATRSTNPESNIVGMIRSAVGSLTMEAIACAAPDFYFIRYFLDVVI